MKKMVAALLIVGSLLASTAFAMSPAEKEDKIALFNRLISAEEVCMTKLEAGLARARSARGKITFQENIDQCKKSIEAYKSRIEELKK